MIRGCVAACAATALAYVLVAPVSAEPASPHLDPGATIAKANQALGRAIGNYTLVDMNGASLALRDYRGKPLVISLIYTACSSVCPPTTQHVIDAVNEAGRMIGLDRFNVLTVGFDAHNDTPARLTPRRCGQHPCKSRTSQAIFNLPLTIISAPFRPA